MKQINSLELTQPDEPSVFATLMNSSLQPQSLAVEMYEQKTSHNALTWSQESIKLQSHLAIPQVADPVIPTLKVSTEGQYQAFLKKIQLSSNCQINIEQTAKWLTAFLTLDEELVDAVGVHYQGRPAFLILTHKRIICLSSSNPSQEVRIAFVLQLKGINQVVTSEKGLEIYGNNIKVKFDNKQSAKQFVGNLSRFVATKTQKRSYLNSLLAKTPLKEVV